MTSCGESAASVLPVILISFKGKYASNKVQLSWNTATELNNEKFIIESPSTKRILSQSVRSLEMVLQIQLQSYRFDDLQLTHPYNYYRLKQIDYDGVFEYHKTILVSLDTERFTDFELFPSPISDGKISIPSILNGSSELVIYDLSGAVKLKKILTESELDVRMLQKGMYLIELTQGRNIRRAKFITE